MICANCTEEVPDGNFCPSCGQPPLLNGTYQLDQIVGHGAHGTTYRATRVHDGGVFAIKELLVRKVESVKALELFGREVRILRELNHPGVPEFIEELHVDAGRSVALYLVQEFIDGETIAAEYASARGTEAEVFALAAELLDTLRYLHELRPPVIHRDIKPGNIMRAADGRLVLIDFGSVRDAIDTAEGGSTVAGTFGYMAAEQFMGRALPATDIYGVGATIVALLSRRDPQELVGADRTIEWRGKLGLSPVFASILSTMLMEDPDQRASDAGALAEKIRAALRGEVVPIVPPTSTTLTAPSSPQFNLRPVPSAPRTLPSKFRKKYAAGASFNLMFGGIFASAGVFSAVIPLLVAIGTGELFPIAMSLLFFAIFGGIGGVTLWLGLSRLNRAKQAYAHGDAVAGFISNIGSSSYSVNNRSATVFHYEYSVNGVTHQGEFHSWDALDLQPGTQISALVDPSDPSNSVLFDPEQFSTAARIRTQLNAQQEKNRVQLDFSEEVEHQHQVW